MTADAGHCILLVPLKQRIAVLDFRDRELIKLFQSKAFFPSELSATGIIPTLHVLLSSLIKLSSLSAISFTVEIPAFPALPSLSRNPPPLRPFPAPARQPLAHVYCRCRIQQRNVPRRPFSPSSTPAIISALSFADCTRGTSLFSSPSFPASSSWKSTLLPHFVHLRLSSPIWSILWNAPPAHALSEIHDAAPFSGVLP